jgi:hypothetical protein
MVSTLGTKAFGSKGISMFKIQKQLKITSFFPFWEKSIENLIQIV